MFQINKHIYMYTLSLSAVMFWVFVRRRFLLFCWSRLFANCSGYPLEEAPSEFLEQYREMQASLILQAPDGT